MRLLGRISSINVRKVLWTGAEIGVAFEHEPWGDAPLSLADPAFLALNPNGLVPVLVDGAFVLRESNSICRYLVGLHERDDLLPRPPRERALVEQWMDWMATDLNTSWRYAFLAIVRRNPAYGDPARVQASLAAWAHHLGILERQLESTGAYAAGATFTLADIVLGLAVHRWFMTPVDARPELPRLRAYYERLCARPAFIAHGSIGVP